jgi:hypothetical protein
MAGVAPYEEIDSEAEHIALLRGFQERSGTIIHTGLTNSAEAHATHKHLIQLGNLGKTR